MCNSRTGVFRNTYAWEAKNKIRQRHRDKEDKGRVNMAEVKGAQIIVSLA